ncbi:hypothetical protein JCM13304A_17040 [Desulfothermus okinawensis JCM 13304]
MGKFKITGKNEAYNGSRLLTLYTTNSLINRPDSYSINKVEYYLKKNEEGEDYSLIRSEIPFGSIDEIKNSPMKIKVADYIENLNIFFFDKNGSKYDYWDMDDMKTTPYAILLEISFNLKGKTHKLKHLFSIVSNET